MGGRVDDIEAVESNPAVVYVGAATGGVLKTENNGATWMPVFDDQPNLSIGDIAIAPSNPNIVWVGTGEANGRQSSSYGGGLFKSTDGAKTWSFTGLGDSGNIGRIVIDPRDANVVYVAAAGDLFKADPERGLYKTTDGGKTWTKSKFVDDDTGFIDVAMDPSNSHLLIAASYQRRRTPWGFNGGGPGSALWKTTDAGRTWGKIAGGGLPPYGTWGRVGLTFSQSNPNVVYALIEPGPLPSGGQAGGDECQRGKALPDPKRAGLWRSSDKGTTWSLMSNENVRPNYFSQVRTHPKDANTVYVLQRRLCKSSDGGKTFTFIPETVLGRMQDPRVGSVMTSFERDPSGELPANHGDHHAMWIDPGNPSRILLGHDGGVDFSYDSGRSWEDKNWLPLGQFYEVAVDMRRPYYVYGGSQDNGVWGGPSRVRNDAGISREHWFELAQGDGYHVAVEPTDWATIYESVSPAGGHHLWRFNLRTGEQTYIRPTPPRRSDERQNQVAVPIAGNLRTPLAPNEVLRWNVNPRVLISPHNPRVLYFGANRLFKSYDRGDTWMPMRDLTKDLDRDKLKIMGVASSEPMASKNDGVRGWGTIVAVAESPVVPGVLWVGTDDGNLQVSRDGGVSWTNVADNAVKFPTYYYVEYVEASHFDAGTAYAAFDGHLSGDFKPHLFKTTDYGNTWTSISSNLPERGHVNVIREDRFNRDLLFVGTEFGFFVSLDGGKEWSKLMNNLPATISDDVLVHPREQDLVLATHGRSFYILDDITPLQQLSADVLAKHEHLFRPRPAVLWSDDRTAFHGGADDLFRAKNPPDAIISYYLGAPASGSVQIQIADAGGAVVRELDGSHDEGIHRVAWDLRTLPQQTFDPPPPLQLYLAKPPVGPRIEPGDYIVRLIVNGRTLTVPLRVEIDPNRE